MEKSEGLLVHDLETGFVSARCAGCVGDGDIVGHIEATTNSPPPEGKPRYRCSGCSKVLEWV